MSRNEWARGTIILPAASVVPLRRELIDAHNAQLDKQYEAAQAFWRSLTSTQKTKAVNYERALGAWAERHRWWDGDLWDLRWRLQCLGPRRLLQSDLQRSTMKTRSWALDEFQVTEVGRTLHYDVGQNNHAVEHAERTWLHQTLMAGLGKIRWTRGTGGVILGNDEYNEEAGREYLGGGGSYPLWSIGPVGQREAPHHQVPWMDTAGRTHR